MKKALKIVAIFIGLLYLVYVILALTNVFKMYTIPSSANAPGIEANSKIFVSNLIEFKNGDFVCYKYKDETLGNHVRVHRLLGSSGDVVEIKDGVFYINEQNLDKNIELKHFYLIKSEDFQQLLVNESIPVNTKTYKVGNKLLVNLLDKVAKENGLTNDIKIEPKNETDRAIKKIYNRNWNTDNFGPLKIPLGKCFVIGDNRHNSLDSRFIGLVNISDIVGTVIKQ